MREMEFEICKGVTFRDLCQEIMDRSDNKKNQVDTLYGHMRTYITDAASALNFVGQLKGLIETGIKNDEQLVKLAGVIQRLQSAQIEATGGEGTGLSEEEKEQLLKDVMDIHQETTAPIPAISGSEHST